MSASERIAKLSAELARQREKEALVKKEKHKKKHRDYMRKWKRAKALADPERKRKQSRRQYRKKQQRLRSEAWAKRRMEAAARREALAVRRAQRAAKAQAQAEADLKAGIVRRPTVRQRGYAEGYATAFEEAQRIHEDQLKSLQADLAETRRLLQEERKRVYDSDRDRERSNG